MRTRPEPAKSLEDVLCDEFAKWCRDNELPDDQCAEELLMMDIDSDQRRWLCDFILRWDAMLTEEGERQWGLRIDTSRPTS